MQLIIIKSNRTATTHVNFQRREGYMVNNNNKKYLIDQNGGDDDGRKQES